MLNSLQTQKSLELVFRLQFFKNFLIECFFLLYGRNWSNFISRMCLLNLALSVPCVKVRDNQTTEANEAFIITVKISKRKASQRQREVYLTFKSVPIFQIFKNFYILVIIVIATIITDKITKKNIAENSTEVGLKTPSDFQSPSNRQELQSSNEFDRSTISACFSSIFEKFTIKQADIMGSFAEILIKNQAKNINKISDETGKKLETFNDSLTAHNKAKSSTGVATISINPSKQKLQSNYNYR